MMNAWGKSLDLLKVKLIPDGSGELTRKMGVLVAKDNLGSGMRSWRYAALINYGMMQQRLGEEGFSNNCETGPHGVSPLQNALENAEPSGCKAANSRKALLLIARPDTGPRLWMNYTHKSGSAHCQSLASSFIFILEQRVNHAVERRSEIRGLSKDASYPSIRRRGYAPV